jgi:hypothetical protein
MNYLTEDGEVDVEKYADAIDRAYDQGMECQMYWVITEYPTSCRKCGKVIFQDERALEESDVSNGDANDKIFFCYDCGKRKYLARYKEGNVRI